MSEYEAHVAPPTRVAKGRSASICATSCASLEEIAESASTPTARRRRPATRSQSARISAGRTAKRRPAAPPTTGTHHLKNHCISEPKLADQATPEISPYIKRKGNRRGTSVYHRKSTAFLDVPDIRSGSQSGPELEQDEDSYRIRSFSFTTKGIVNRGDSFRRRRSRSNSLCPPSVVGTPSPIKDVPDLVPHDASKYNVALIGTQGVGKTTLISQFMTSECINAYDRQKDTLGHKSVSIMLNGEESELTFIHVANPRDIDRLHPPDAFVVVYSVVDKASFSKVEAELTRLQDADLLRSRPTIIVGNKIDLARSRAVSTQDGKCLACMYRAKFIEISVGINHNVDELLVGILTQIRLKSAHYDGKEYSSQQWYKSRGVVRASMKARQMFTWIFGKEDTKFKNCENLQIL